MLATAAVHLHLLELLCEFAGTFSTVTSHRHCRTGLLTSIAYMSTSLMAPFQWAAGFVLVPTSMKVSSRLARPVCM